ncbi:hypothetical protein P9A28_gp49 [Sphingomonas phage Eidolon]|uniref:Uncharacterized protein n=1 Tax=Sphingomonas phage Eidolon TaxID=2686311 RepID=A0A6M3TCI1_9CAUD|nr:hypothetical protein P9A28_gp49 [Sphingomonas phage Eidolon]QJD54435.1 hypothetical protein [Sphingomonas phage Eidolon]
MTDKKTTTKAKEPAEVKSNHNTTEPAKPIQTAQVKSMPDYNPMRREGSKANVLSDTSMNEDDNAEVVAEKGDRPTVAETDAASPWGEKTAASEAPAEGDAAKGAK